MPDDARDRILGATVVCLGRYGIAKTTVDDAAREAGIARATVYRYFPDGKEQLIGESITWAVGQFFHELAVSIADAPDFPTLLEEALVHAHQAVAEHVVLQKVLETEPERLLPQLTQSAPQVQAVLRDYLADKLRHESLLPGVDPLEAGDWLARMGLSFILAEGRWDLTDPASVRRLVREELLVSILQPEALNA
ncbi:TetR/AcrR family transcriptional regulator [Aquihabitans daechungensis]|uniref:TetR/AcrR family transcriptional regulator n=1 Tax=Aquihabitans daechungensis TaxID=1052257 RepID=UPI003B9FC5FA